VPLFMHLCNFRNVHVSIQSFQNNMFSVVFHFWFFKCSPACQGVSSFSKELACKWDQIRLRLRCQYYLKGPQLWMEYCYLKQKVWTLKSSAVRTILVQLLLTKPICIFLLKTSENISLFDGLWMINAKSRTKYVLKLQQYPEIRYP
jgi:hypothetical protein